MLARAHKITPGELATVLKLGAPEIENHLKVLADAGVLKSESKAAIVRLKSKNAELIEVLCAHFNVVVKKDAVLKSDGKLAKQLREARHRAEKEARKQKAAKSKAAEIKSASKGKVVKPAVKKSR